jgi:arylsulfatase A-like enzyme
MNAIVLTFDRLPLSFLGCYGNRGIETPSFDRLAASSVVFDQHLVESALLPNALSGDRIADAWWTGRYQFARNDGQRGGQGTLSEILHAAGIETRLISERGVSVSSQRMEFRDTIEVGGEDGWDVEDANTPIAQLVSSAVEHMQRGENSDESSSLLWLRSGGVPVPWIPPRSFAESYLDELDAVTDAAEIEVDLDAHVLSGGALTAEGTEKGDRSLFPGEKGPVPFWDLTASQWQNSRAMFAAYVELLDAWLGRLLECLEERFAQQKTLFIVTAGSGCWLGEGQTEGSSLRPLGDELVHVPLLVRCFDSNDSGSHRRELTQSIDVVPTLLDWFGIDHSTFGCEGRSLLGCICDDEGVERTHVFLGDDAGNRGVRTQDFYLIKPDEFENRRDHSAIHQDRPRLFVKPDDLWEIHDVAAQYPDQVDRLSSQIDAFLRSIDGTSESS